MCCSRRVAGRLSDARQDGASQIDEYGAHSTSLLLKPMDKNKKNMKKMKPPILKYTKESPAARKKRVSSGVKFRAVVIESKKRKLLDKSRDSQDAD